MAAIRKVKKMKELIKEVAHSFAGPAFFAVVSFVAFEASKFGDESVERDVVHGVTQVACAVCK